jgi:hypothetical protein
MVSFNGEGCVAMMAHPTDSQSSRLMDVASIRPISRATSIECVARFTCWFPPHQSLPNKQKISPWKRDIFDPPRERIGDYR